ncbi:MAG: glutamate--tRNA ligase family protein, partial [Bacilli bacterium]
MTARLCYSIASKHELDLSETRKALITFLFAKKMRGTFLVRIDDSENQDPNLHRYQGVYDDLAWLNLAADESPINPNPLYAPYLQSEKLSVYQRYLDVLEKMGVTYQKVPPRAAKTSDFDIRPAVYLRVKDAHQTSFSDLILGKIAISRLNFNDWMIVRSDGLPTFEFASMIDDHIMNISHVIRDVDQLPNMGHYLILFSYLNWPLPSFAHLPSLRRFKNSQSDGDMVFSKIATLREDGYLPEAICNYFYDLDFVEDAKLEIKLFSDLANSFDLRKIFLGKLVFDFESLRHLNALYIKELSASEFRSFITPFIKNLVNDVLGEDYLIELATLFKKQISHGREILDYCLPFIDEQPLFTPSQ